MSAAPLKKSSPPSPERCYLVLRAALERFEKTPGELSAKERDAVERRVERELQVGERVLSSPEAREVMVPEATVTQGLEGIKARYADEVEFLVDLNANGLDEEGLRKALHRELTVEAVLDRVAARAPDVSELDAMIYYYMHPQRFERPERRAVRHILITINPELPENTREAARKRLETVAGRVARKPHRFREQAAKHSECPSALHEGLIGTVARGTLFPELDEVLFQLEAGEIGPLVESPMGFHLLLCEAVESAGPMPFDEARERIQTFLQDRRRRQCQVHWLAALGADAEESDER